MNQVFKSIKYVLLFFTFIISNLSYAQIESDSNLIYLNKACDILSNSDYTNIDSISLNEGITFCDKILINNYHDSSYTYYIRGNIYNHLRKRELAKLDFYKAIKIQPNEFEYYASLHQLLWTQQLKKKESKELRQLGFSNFMKEIRKDSLNAKLWYDLAKILDLDDYYQTKEDADKIIKYYYQSLKIDSTNGKCWFDLSSKYRQVSVHNFSLQKEAKCLRNAIKYSDCPFYRECLSGVYIEQKLFSKALTLIKEGISLFPDDKCFLPQELTRINNILKNKNGKKN